MFTGLPTRSSSIGPRSPFSATRTGHGARRTRHLHRPHADRSRVERHQGAEYPCSALNLFLLLARFPVFGWLLGADAGLAARTTFTKGLLHTDQRQVVEASLEQATLARDVWTKKIEGDSFAAVQSDPRLMTVVRQSGRTLFGDNCAVCHGLDAKGGKAIFAANCVSCHGADAKGNLELGAPNLTDKLWIYGGNLETIDTSVWGGRQGHMPTWEGRLSALDRQILALYLVDKRAPDQ